MNALARARAGAVSLTQHPRVRRVARITAIALVASVVAYFVGMNVFLRTRLFRSAITSDTGSLLVDYRSAYSPWPGRIHVEGLVIRGRDSSVEWILRLDRCDFRVSFMALTRKRFHASHVNGDGLSLRVRLRRDGPVLPEEMQALPPVPGFLDPPLADVGPPPAPLTDANYNLWSIDLEDVDANHVRELWIDTVRYAGDLEVRGRWFFRPLRWLDVGPATVTLRSLEVGYGVVEPWLSGATGALVATVHPFALQEVLGADMLDRFSVDGDVGGTLRAANVLGRVLEAPDPGVARATRAEDAPVDAHLRLDHGVLRSGTQVQIDRFAGVAHAGGLVIDASVTAQAHVDDEGTGHLRVGSTGLRIAQGASKSLRATAVAVTLATRDLDLARVGEGCDLSGGVDGEGLLVRADGTMASARSVSVVATSARLQPGARPLKGAFTMVADALSFEQKALAVEAHRLRVNVSADVDTVPAAGTGDALVVAQGLRARIGDASVDGELRLDVRARESTGGTTLSGSALAFNGTAGPPPVPWWFRATLPQAFLDARSGLRFRAQVAANAKDASPLAAIVAKNTAVPRWVINAISTEGFVATGQLVVGPATLQARSVTARAAGIDLGFELAQLGPAQEWALLVDVGAVTAGIDVSDHQTDVLLFGAKPWFEKKTASLRAVERRYE